MEDEILDYAESLHEEATETLTELEYHLLSHPEYDRDERLYVEFPPENRKPSRAEELIERSVQETVEVCKEIEGLKEELNINHERNQQILKVIEAKAAKLVTQATKIAEDPEHEEWVFRKTSFSYFNLDLSEIDYTPKREENEEQIS